MKITLHVKPQVLIGLDSKAAILAQIKSKFGISPLPYPHHRRPSKNVDDEVVVYNLEKCKRKFRRAGRMVPSTKIPNKMIPEAILVRHMSWKAYVYVFRKGFPLKMEQHERHFSFNTTQSMS